jgi:hypothetical protein
MWSVLAKTGANPVSQVLQHYPDFYEWQDYPEGGVWDRASGYGYFYHAHPGAAFEQEHGHFHLFWTRTKEVRLQLAAISMSAQSEAIGLFVPNRWHLAGEAASTDQASKLYREFSIELAFPCLAANRWLSALVRSLADELSKLLGEADKMLAVPTRQGQTPVHEDRQRSILVFRKVGVIATVAATALPKSKSPVAATSRRSLGVR